MALASQSSLALVLFLVLVGACPLTAEPGVVFHPDVSTDYVRNVGKAAVDEYNKNGEPHLYFIAVVNATVVTQALLSQAWYLELKAANCSSLSDTRAALYLAQILERTLISPENKFSTVFELRTFYRK